MAMIIAGMVQRENRSEFS